MSVQRPIVIISSGRSGSTLLHEMLSRHADLSWLSRVCDLSPDRLRHNRFVLRTVDLPLVGRAVRSKFPPDECYRFWEHYFPGFGRPFRDLRSDDVTVSVKRRLRAALGEAVLASKPRLLLKITGWPRVAFLHELLPEARFIHLVRDGRAVANSLLKVSWWRGWGGTSGWRFGNLTPEEMARWDVTGRSFIALAGLAWTRILDAVEVATADLPEGRVLEIRYEDLCQDHVQCVRQIADFCDIKWTAGFARRLQKIVPRSTNDRWRVDLTKEQQGIVTEIVRSHLEAHGYV